jgi:hypothetical protein
MNRMDREDYLHTAFQYFDSSGYITEEDAELAVKNHGTWLMSRSLSQGSFNIF